MNREPIYLNADVTAVLNALVKAQNEGKCTVFFEMMGHVQQLYVQIYAPNWIKDKSPDFKHELYITRTDDIEFTIRKIKEFKDRVIDYLDSLPASNAFLTSKIDPMQKKVTNLDEAKAHFAESIDTVNGEKDGESKELTSLAEAEAFYAETIGDADNSGAGLPEGGQQQQAPLADANLAEVKTGEEAEAGAQLQSAQAHEQTADNGEGRV